MEKLGRDCRNLKHIRQSKGSEKSQSLAGLITVTLFIRQFIAKHASLEEEMQSLFHKLSQNRTCSQIWSWHGSSTRVECLLFE